MLRRILLAILLTLGCLNLQAETNSPAWKRAEHLRHGINAGEWFAQSHDYSPQRLRTFTTLDDIVRMHTMGFDHVRLSIDPAISSATALGTSARKCRCSTKSWPRRCRWTWR